MDKLSSTFAALADPTRRAILARLALGRANVGELGKPFRMSAPAISRHLRVLANAGLIEREVDAQRRVCRLRGEALVDAQHWIEKYRQHWEDSLDRLADYLERPGAPLGGAARARATQQQTAATHRPAPRTGTKK